jgi:hypothetical protein
MVRAIKDALYYGESVEDERTSKPSALSKDDCDVPLESQLLNMADYLVVSLALLRPRSVIFCTVFILLFNILLWLSKGETTGAPGSYPRFLTLACPVRLR